MQFFTGRRGLFSIIGIVLAIALSMSVGKLFEDVDSGEIVVIQSPVSGDLSVYTDSGPAWQGFGTVTRYPRRGEFKFDGGKEAHSSAGLGVRFYDGGTAELKGSISWLMPTDPKAIIALHRDFRSAEAFEMQAIRRSMESAATFSGPTMSSFESAAGKRNELLQILNDQTLHGVYKTISQTERVKDVAGIERDTAVTKIVKDERGAPVRAQASYVEQYRVTMLPMTIHRIDYEERVEKQIREQQQATNAAIVAKANATKADQDTITAEAQGKANAAKAKWEQEVLNAKTVADAQAKITIADAGVKEAEAFKKAETLRGEGEANRKRAVMEADGQLEKKLEALVAVNAKYAEAIAKAQPGAWAPSVQMGGGSGANGSGDRAMGLVELLTAKTARDLGIDLGVKGSAATKK